MTRSRKKIPKIGVSTSPSEKEDKTRANRKLRRKVKQSVLKDEEMMPELREVSNIEEFSKDGKMWMKKKDPKDLRK